MTILEFIGFGEGVKAAQARFVTRREESRTIPPIDFRFLAERESISGKRDDKHRQTQAPARGSLREPGLIRL
jgi:hypothetical protein